MISPTMCWLYYWRIISHIYSHAGASTSGKCTSITIVEDIVYEMESKDATSGTVNFSFTSKSHILSKAFSEEYTGTENFFLTGNSHRKIFRRIYLKERNFGGNLIGWIWRFDWVFALIQVRDMAIRQSFFL